MRFGVAEKRGNEAQGTFHKGLKGQACQVNIIYSSIYNSSRPPVRGDACAAAISRIVPAPLAPLLIMRGDVEGVTGL